MDAPAGHDRGSGPAPESGAPGMADDAVAGTLSGSAVAVHRLRPPTPRVALLLAAALLVGVVLYLGRGALGPFVVGLLLVYLLDPPIERLARLGLPRWLAILGVYAATVLVLVQAVGFVVRPLIEQVRAFATDLPGLLAQLETLYRTLDLPAPIREAIDHWLAQLAAGGGFDPTVLLPVFNVTASFVGAIFGYAVIPVWAFYLLKDRRELTAAFDRALPGEWRADVWQVVAIVQRVFGQWIRGQLFLGLVVGVATFVGLLVLAATVHPIFGRFALLLAIVAGVLELLPIIGPIIASVPAILLALTAGPQAVVATLVLYTLVQQVENTILVPKIQGDAVQLHPSAVIFALILGGAIAGLLGAILALPITAAGRDVYRYLFRRLSGGSIAAAREASGTAPVSGDAATRSPSTGHPAARPRPAEPGAAAGEPIAPPVKRPIVSDG